MRVLLIAYLAAGSAFAAPPPEAWSPVRWHSHDPATLALIKDTPVNCLLLEPHDWDASFLAAAGSAGVAILAVIRPDTSAKLTAAGSLPFDGIVLEGDFETPPVYGGLLRIELPSRARIRLDDPGPIVGTSQALWPGLEIEHSGKAIAGPTSAPWINTNGGFLRFLRARTGKTVWLGARPPPRTIFPIERYLQAIGDAAIPGARWIVTLDSDFEARLYRREPSALRDWKRVTGHLRFYDRWRQSSNYGKFGVVIDRNTGGLLSGFLLDMLAAQRTSATVVPPGRIGRRALREITALLDLERAQLTAGERQALDEFIANGGVVLKPPDTVQFPAPDAASLTPSRRDLDRLQGLWEMVYNATLRKNFGVRAFNTVGVLTGIATPDGGRSVLVHLLNFTDYEGEAITVHVLGNWKRAKLYLPDSMPRELKVYPVKEGTAVEIERFATAAAIHFE